ncbi:uncharacterized protein [Centruroides vittatus]|uniref:uncharacterized protein isoform X2 n=1 Tax=Centruroides vittatus TaxID=120091 RepID=UPI00350EAA8C
MEKNKYQKNLHSEEILEKQRATALDSIPDKDLETFKDVDELYLNIQEYAKERSQDYSEDEEHTEFYSAFDSEQNYFEGYSSAEEYLTTTGSSKILDVKLPKISSTNESKEKQSWFSSSKTSNSKESLNPSDYIPMIFPPKVHKGMNTSLRGGAADRFIREALENEINPKWFIKLSRYQLKVFFALFKFLAVTKNVLAIQIFGMLKNLDIALTLEEVESVIKKFHEEYKRIDFYHLLFALCNTNDYLQRLKNDAELRKNQMHETFTKRQLLFYTITSLAMFPEYPIDPIYHRLKTKYNSHPLHQFLICQRMQGLPPRLARKRELEMIEEIAKWKKKILSAYSDIPPVPSEPPLVYLQRKRREAIKRDEFLGNIPSPICIKEEESYKRRKEAVVRRDSDAEDTCNLIDKIVNSTYKDKAKPSRRIKPNDWVQHTMFRLLAPLPLIPVPKAQLEAMKKYHVSVFQLPGTYDKVFKDYFIMKKSDSYVKKPWCKPSFWTSVRTIHERPPFA